MASLTEIVTILQKLNSIRAIIADGELRDDATFGPRHLLNTPYIEIVEDTVNFDEHSSDTRTRRTTASGRIILKKDVDSINGLSNDLELKFYGEDTYKLELNDVVAFSPRLQAKNFTLNYFASVDKPPAVPCNFEIAVISSTRIDLMWLDRDRETGYSIERSLDQIVWGGQNVAANTTFASDTTLSPNTLYFYRMRAFNDAGFSRYTQIESATTLP